MTTHARVMPAGLLVACGTLAVAVGVTTDDDPATTPKAAPKGPYVALGDSYTAGPGIPDRTGTPAGCDRSDRNHPALVAAELGLKGTDFRDVSCSGATITDLTGAQSTDDGTNPAQLTALTSDTRLVTVGVGGNDIGFSSMIKRCVGMGALYKLAGSGKYTSEDAPCARQYADDSDEGHDACSAEGARWMEPLVPKSPAAAVHPNERGERGMAAAVLHRMRSAL